MAGQGQARGAGQKPTLMKINQRIFARSLGIVGTLSSSALPHVIHSICLAAIIFSPSHMQMRMMTGPAYLFELIISYNASVHNRNCISLGDEKKRCSALCLGFLSSMHQPPFFSCLLLIFYLIFFSPLRQKGLLLVKYLHLSVRSLLPGFAEFMLHYK